MDCGTILFTTTAVQTAGETFRPLMTPEEIMMRYASAGCRLQAGASPKSKLIGCPIGDRELAGPWDDPGIAPRVETANVSPGYVP